jgi:hypothetical protein
MKVLAIRFSGNANQFQGFLNFCEEYSDLTVKDLTEKEYLLV